MPDSGSRSEWDLSHWLFERKAANWKGLDLTIAAPSRWMAECVRSSRLFGGCRTEVIPTGVDLTTFRPVERTAARAALGLPQDKQLILFGALNATSDTRKGVQLLTQALESLSHGSSSKNYHAVIFGDDVPAGPGRSSIPCTHLGYFGDDSRLASLYSAADMVVMPSLEDNLPNVAIEAIACGTPVVGFDATGMPDIVDHLQNGYLAKAFDPEDLARGIEWVLADPQRLQDLSGAARRKAESTFSLDRQAVRYMELYRELISARAASGAIQGMT